MPTAELAIHAGELFVLILLGWVGMLIKNSVLKTEVNLEKRFGMIEGQQNAHERVDEERHNEVSRRLARIEEHLS